jgi:dienelactone hydrolase
MAFERPRHQEPVHSAVRRVRSFRSLGFCLLLGWALGACSSDGTELHTGDQTVGGSGGTISAGGSGGSAHASSGTDTGHPWPRPDDSPTLSTASGLGPYQYESYARGFPIAKQAFSSATIFYPTSATPPFSAIALCPGFTEVEQDFLTWGMLLASHGIVALVLTPKNTGTDSPENRGDELLAALDTLVSENLRSQGPLHGHIATDRLGVMGHSMGGGGSLFACDKGSARMRAVVALMPWQPGGTYPKCTAPTLVVAAQKDGLVSPDGMALPEFQSLPATEKVFMNVAGTDHNTANDISGGNNVFARYALSWLKVHLEDDHRYLSFVSGDAHQADVNAKTFIKFIP